MKTNEKILVYITTIVIDILLIWILVNQKLNKYDTIFIFIAIFVHLLFYIGLFFNNRKLLDICHYMISIMIIFSIFIKNETLMMLLLSLIIVIYITWGLFNKCILNTAKQNETNLSYELTGFTAVTLYNTVVLILLLKLTNIIQ
jgi:hypothetical protein